MIYKKAIENGILTFRELANDLRTELTKLQPPKVGRVVAKGAFGPSFAESEDTDQPYKEDEKEKTKGKGKGKGKRKLTAGELSAKCPACDIQGHILAKYLYIFPDQATKTF